MFSYVGGTLLFFYYKGMVMGSPQQIFSCKFTLLVQGFGATKFK
jgi:hypothetical protein